MSDDTACKVTTPDQETLRHTSEQDKGVSRDAYEHPDYEGHRHPGQIERREHWRKADRDDRGPASRLLPVGERDGTHVSVSAGGRFDAAVGFTPQRDDPTGHGFAGMPDVTPEQLRKAYLSMEDPDHERLPPPYDKGSMSAVPGCLSRVRTPHPDDPHGVGYHGCQGPVNDEEIREEVDREFAEIARLHDEEGEPWADAVRRVMPNCSDSDVLRFATMFRIEGGKAA